MENKVEKKLIFDYKDGKYKYIEESEMDGIDTRDYTFVEQTFDTFGSHHVYEFELNGKFTNVRVYVKGITSAKQFKNKVTKKMKKKRITSDAKLLRRKLYLVKRSYDGAVIEADKGE